LPRKSPHGTPTTITAIHHRQVTSVSLHAHSLPLRLAASLGLIALAHRWALDSPFNVEKVKKERENMTRVSRKRTGDSFVEPGLSLARPIRPEGKK
jgi:hypothetical protein